MTIATTIQGQLTVVGAPRYQHRGLVMAVSEQMYQTIDPFQWHVRGF